MEGETSTSDLTDPSLRERSKSHETHLIVRTTSDPDLSSRGRSRSNASQCSRSRSQTKTQISVDELLMDAQALKPKKLSLGQGPRPNPDGMAATSNAANTDGITIKVTEPRNANQMQDLMDDDRDFMHERPRTATEVLEKRRAMQRQNEAAFLKLRAELERAHYELRKRDEECKKLSSVRDDLDKEVEELTASLFEEAHKMVTEAKTKQASAEMQLKEAKMKILMFLKIIEMFWNCRGIALAGVKTFIKQCYPELDGLEAEVAALKMLVITSTPSNPGKKGHRRAPSADQICSECQTYHCEMDGLSVHNQWDVIDSPEEKEVDRIAHREFIIWLEKHCPMIDCQFLETIEKQDIAPCLQFPNQELAAEVFTAIKENSLVIEPVSGSNRSRRCSLSRAAILCSYRFRIGETGKWNFISNGCRSRIIAVADLYTFLRYIKQGLIRKEINEMYWEVVRKRSQISLARLGLVKM